MGGLAGAEVTGGAGATACLPIDIFAVLDGEHIQPFRSDAAVENAIGPDPVGPDLVLLKVAFQRFAVERMIGEVTESFFHSFSRVGEKGVGSLSFVQDAQEKTPDPLSFLRPPFFSSLTP